MKHPESKMMSAGYHPEDFEGSLKQPVFHTSTFAIPSAEVGKREFEIAFGVREASEGEQIGHLYSRLGNPNVSLLEKRLAILEGSESAVVFGSGMAAISTLFQAFLKPGDLILHSSPLYGGTYHYIKHFLSEWGVSSCGFDVDESMDSIIACIEENHSGRSPSLIYLETPSNPTNDLFSISMARSIADYFTTEDSQPLVVVDNTYLGPLFQKPMEHGADMVVYSATKFLGGHSDLIAGAVTASSGVADKLKLHRTFMGTPPDPMTCWMITRSLETLTLRMNQQCDSAIALASWLDGQSMVKKVNFPTLLRPEVDGEQYRIYQHQCTRPGSVLSFRIRGGEREAFRFLNSLKMTKLAVSLGSTESLAEHPYTMTHLDLFDEREKYGVTPDLVRISVGVEHIEDIVADISQALDQVKIIPAAEIDR